MKENIIASRYAQALFSEAKSDGKAEDVIAQLSAISALYDASEDFKVLVKNPLIKKEAKQSVIDELKNRGALDEFLYKFLTLLVSKNRLSLLHLIAEQVIAMDMKDKGKAEAFVTVASPLDDASKSSLNDVLSKLTGKKITIRETVDASILGGVIAQVESSLYDASVKGQLNKIKEQLI
ncbi:ATP synthase F1, delta subunit [Denitrovibrio acetiphilus DSM 12809]|uniref:ATP synthase subunit delta n=1 Tax=Denitrovibrio acetiphilus (strain DSM 12809 / NBRC 114555 / N2460) TaxID=522772 RepID=D4H614_DENA2|nr:ATP synthase F1 subunit delta [Denitrovibrio acetiphilus]ADD67660.1 ATP synthase F1, delta subunit [Denitrovibrio acetiphilus DSM 12809]